MLEISLVEYEVAGLKSAYTFAKGHAYHDMPDMLLSARNKINLIYWLASIGEPNLSLNANKCYA